VRFLFIFIFTFLHLLVNRTEAQKDIHRASLMWMPLKEDEQKHEEGILFGFIDFIFPLIGKAISSVLVLSDMF